MKHKLIIFMVSLLFACGLSASIFTFNQAGYINPSLDENEFKLSRIAYQGAFIMTDKNVKGVFTLLYNNATVMLLEGYVECKVFGGQVSFGLNINPGYLFTPRLLFFQRALLEIEESNINGYTGYRGLGVKYKRQLNNLHFSIMFHNTKTEEPNSGYSVRGQVEYFPLSTIPRFTIGVLGHYGKDKQSQFFQQFYSVFVNYIPKTYKKPETEGGPSWETGPLLQLKYGRGEKGGSVYSGSYITTGYRWKSFDGLFRYESFKDLDGAQEDGPMHKERISFGATWRISPDVYIRGTYRIENDKLLKEKASVLLLDVMYFFH